MSAAVQQGALPFLERDRGRVDAVLLALCDRLFHGVDPAIAGPVHHAVGAGGKRLRPILCVAAWRAASGGDETAAPDALLELACGIELLHTYSLMHDDLPSMDDDDLRRGRPTAHRVFGVRATSLAGAALIPLAMRVLDDGGRRMGLAADRRQASISILATAAGAAGMVGGQMLDLEAEGQRLDIDALSNLHARKTGALFAAASRIGAVVAGADATGIAAFGRYGEALGTAFQIADDLLDVTGTASLLGKNAGKDEAAEKATYPGLLGIGEAHARAQAARRAAVAALELAGIASPALAELARYAVERDR